MFNISDISVYFCMKVLSWDLWYKLNESQTGWVCFGLYCSIHAPVNHLHRQPDILCKLVLESFNLPDEVNSSCYVHDQKHGRAQAHQTHCAVYSNQLV